MRNQTYIVVSNFATINTVDYIGEQAEDCDSQSLLTVIHYLSMWDMVSFKINDKLPDTHTHTHTHTHTNVLVSH